MANQPAAMRFLVYRDAAGEWRWRLVGGNGEPVAASEGYSTKSNAERSARRLKSEVWRASIERDS